MGKSQEQQHIIKGPDKVKWSKGMSNDTGHLLQVLGYIQGPNTCFFIHIHKVSQGAKVAYIHIFCNIGPRRKIRVERDSHWEGTNLRFNGSVSAPTSNLLTSKLHWNSVILNAGAKYLVVDAKNFYLNNLMPKNQFHKIALSLIP